MKRESVGILGSSTKTQYEDGGRFEGALTPQKKWRIKITITLRATFGPEYKLLKGKVLPSLSRSIMFSMRRKVSWDGRSLFVEMSPLK